VIVEPMAGSTGVLPAPKGYLKRLREICDKYGILLIFDEVITGFGRLGYAFAAERYGVMPDMITFAKGVTNGTVPMGGVIVRDTIYDAFMQRPGARDRTVPRLHLFGASARLRRGAGDARPLSRRKAVRARQGARAEIRADAVMTLKGLPNVLDIRTVGLTAGIDLASRPGARSALALGI
jgi:beta-alanine--pyruvate transaminase